VTPGHLGRAGPWVVWAAGAFALVWAMSVGWWALLQPAAAATETEVVVPAGTAARIAAGEAVFLPSAYQVRDGGALVVINRDSVSHTVGTAVIPPGATARIAAEAGTLTCTIHPAGAIALTGQPRPPFWSTFLPAVIAGLPLGLVGAGATELARRIG
jgi:plastocyanin